MTPPTVRLVSALVDAGVALVVSDGRVKLRGRRDQGLPEDLRREVHARRQEIRDWMTGHCQGQDLAGMVRMAQARLAAGEPLTPEDQTVLIVQGQQESSALPA